jgi:DNA-binding NtrC family response regulator
MHRAVLLAVGDTIEREAIRLPDGSALTQKNADVSDPQTGATMVGRTVAEVEQALILKTLDHCLGNRTHAATILGISIRTLRNKLKQYSDDGLAVPPPAAERASA